MIVNHFNKENLLVTIFPHAIYAIQAKNLKVKKKSKLNQSYLKSESNVAIPNR